MKTLTIRLEDDVHEELERLVTILNCSKNGLVEMLIRQEFNKFTSDPKIKKALDQIQEMRNLLDKFQK